MTVGDEPQTGTAYPGHHAREAPERPAVVLAGSGRSLTYAELDERSRRFAAVLHDRGLRVGDHFAMVLENRAEFLEVAWAGQRSGLYFTPMSPRLTAGELAHIIGDCDAQALVVSAGTAGLPALAEHDLPALHARFVVGGATPGYEDYETALAVTPPDPSVPEVEGQRMMYSSGTTGRPKGIYRALQGQPAGAEDKLTGRLRRLYGVTGASVFLTPAPLYHGAPMGFSLSAMRIGATLVVMEKFDAEAMLATIEAQRVTHLQCVPTMLIRLLRLPPEVRGRYDLSSLRCVIHAAAPCPAPIKQEVIEWLGPIVHEYYAGSEGTGFVAINSEEWLAHVGSVGRILEGEVHIVGDDGVDLGPGETGQVYFAGSAAFEYHKDAEATAAAFDERGWTTLGDVGHLDDDGFLYLTDRKTFLIISGGVNVYPQEVENVLASHPDVADAAVIGVPDPDLGERVLAVVQAEAGRPVDGLEDELRRHCREHLAGFKCPKDFAFVDALPREENGKLYKRLLREQYATSGGPGVPAPGRS